MELNPRTPRVQLPALLKATRIVRPSGPRKPRVRIVRAQPPQQPSER